jgi:cytochrome c-type biogenesis protein CcmH/NrfG
VLQQIFGKEHQNVLSAASNLARILSQQCEHTEAVALFRNVVLVSKRVFGQDHPNTLAQTNFLASALHKQGEHAEAGLMFQQLLPKMISTYGKDHFNVFNVSENLDMCTTKMRTMM